MSLVPPIVPELHVHRAADAHSVETHLSTLPSGSPARRAAIIGWLSKAEDRGTLLTERRFAQTMCPTISSGVQCLDERCAACALARALLDEAIALPSPDTEVTSVHSLTQFAKEVNDLHTVVYEPKAVASLASLTEDVLMWQQVAQLALKTLREAQGNPLLADNAIAKVVDYLEAAERREQVIEVENETGVDLDHAITERVPKEGTVMWLRPKDSASVEWEAVTMRGIGYVVRSLKATDPTDTAFVTVKDFYVRMTPPPELTDIMSRLVDRADANEDTTPLLDECRTALLDIKAWPRVPTGDLR